MIEINIIFIILLIFRYFWKKVSALADRLPIPVSKKADTDTEAHHYFKGLALVTFPIRFR